MNARTDQIKNYNPLFDLVRGLASLMVFVAHMQIFIMAMMPDGGDFFENYYIFEVLAVMGVEFFFVLSGLLLGPILYSHFQKPDIWKNCKIFMMRRWYRTLPTYYLGFLAFLFLFWILQKPLPDHWPSYLFFMQSPVEFKSEFYGVSWTMAVEEIFYVLFPILCFVILCSGKSPEKVFVMSLLAVSAFCFGLRFYIMPDTASLDYNTIQGSLMRLDAIAYGALIGIFVRRIHSFIFGSSVILLMFFSGYLVVNGYQILSDFMFFVFFHAVFFVIPVCSAIIIKFSAQYFRLKENKIIKFLADISYPLYILHVPILFLMIPENAVVTPVMLVFYFWFCIGFSYLVFKYIETPILRRRPVYE